MFKLYILTTKSRKYRLYLSCIKFVLISQIFCVCFCWFSGIFTHASFIKQDYCLEKFHTVQIPFFHLPFLVVSILIEVSCVRIIVADSILHIYVVENGNRIIITILEMTVYSFLSESQNFTNVSSLNFGLSILSAFFVGFQRKWLSMNTEWATNPLTLLSKYSKNLLVRGIQIHTVSLGAWLHSGKYAVSLPSGSCSIVFVSDTPSNVLSSLKWHSLGTMSVYWLAVALWPQLQLTLAESLNFSILPKICSLFLHMFLCSLCKQSEILSAVSVSYPLISSYLVFAVNEALVSSYCYVLVFIREVFPTMCFSVKLNLMSDDILLSSWSCHWQWKWEILLTASGPKMIPN
jgi:hypothetical protein